MNEKDWLTAAQSIFGNLVIDVFDYTEPHGCDCGVDLVVDSSQKLADDHGITLQFENGNVVRFSTSEWAMIQRLK